MYNTIVTIADMDGHFRYLNPAWSAVLGRSLEELKARPFLDFVHPDDHESTRREVGKLAEGSDSILFENRYRHQDGRWWFEHRLYQSYARTSPADHEVFELPNISLDEL